jgi:hypothetical protein
MNCWLMKSTFTPKSRTARYAKYDDSCHRPVNAVSASSVPQQSNGATQPNTRASQNSSVAADSGLNKDRPYRGQPSPTDVP